MTTTYRFRQIRIDKLLYLRIKGYCVTQEKKISTFFEEILQWFFDEILSGRHITYQASRKENHLMTISLSDTVAEVLNKLAIKEKVSNARIIFTALTLYLENHQF